MIFQMNDTDNLIQNMVDAGCSEKEVSCFCECYKRQDKEEELDILEVHREGLLYDIHQIRHSMELLEQMLGTLRGDGI